MLWDHGEVAVLVKGGDEFLDGGREAGEGVVADDDVVQGASDRVEDGGECLEVVLAGVGQHGAAGVE